MALEFDPTSAKLADEPRFEFDPSSAKPADQQKPRTRSLIEAANDYVIEGANAAAGGVSSAANFFVPGNKVSSFIDENVIKAGEAKQSDVVKDAKRKLSEGLAGASGPMQELGAVGEYIVENPLLAASQAVGSFALPAGAVKGMTKLATLGGAGAGAASTAGRIGGVAAGAAMAGGDAAGTAYELSKKAGATDEQAKAAGRQASVIPALVGGVTGAFGAEKLLAGGKGFQGGIASRALKTGLSEAGQEAIEEGVTQYEGQRAAMPYDPSIDPTKGVAGAAGMGAALGFIPGAGLGALDAYQNPNRPQAQPQPAPVDEVVEPVESDSTSPVDDVIDVEPITPVKPSEAMGIDRAAGPLSRAAADAVDSGASPAITPTVMENPLVQAAQDTAPTPQVVDTASLKDRTTEELRGFLRNAQDTNIRKAISSELARRKREEMAAMPDPLQQSLIDQPKAEQPRAAEAPQAVQSQPKAPQEQPRPLASLIGGRLTDTDTADLVGKTRDPLRGVIQAEPSETGIQGAANGLSDTGVPAVTGAGAGDTQRPSGVSVAGRVLRRPGKRAVAPADAELAQGGADRAGDGRPGTGDGTAALNGRPARWRQNALQAKKVARELGLNPDGKRLAEIVAEVDAFDARSNVQDTPQGTERVQAQAQADQAPEAARGDGAETGRVPDTRSGDGVRADGVEAQVTTQETKPAEKKAQEPKAEEAAQAQATPQQQEAAVQPQQADKQGEDDDAFMGVKKDEQKDLIITHNLTPENVMHAIRMGGIPVPSLAVTKKDNALSGFGSITLIGKKEMADPKGYAGTKVFGADIYSPRYPSVTYEFTPNMKKRGEAQLKAGMDATDSNYIDWSEVEKGSRELERTAPFLWKFLTDNGITPNVKTVQPAPLEPELAPFAESGMDAYDLTKDDAFIATAWQMRRDMLVKLNEGNEAEADAELGQERARVAERGQFYFANELARKVEMHRRDMRNNGKVDGEATRRALEQQVREAKMEDRLSEAAKAFVADLNPNERIFQGFTNSGNRKYIPHTLENVVKILKKELRGGESFNYGVGSLRAKFTPQFKSVADIRKNKSRLISAEDFDKIKDEINREYLDLSNALNIETETLGSIMEDAATMGVPRAAAQYKVDVGGGRDEQIAEFMTKLRELPTAYFEAKILRPVSIAEFAAAVVPERTNQAVIDAMRKEGITRIVTYKDDAERKEVTRKMAEELGDDAVFMGDKANAKRQGTPVDRAVMDMAGEGRDANDILSFIANTSKSPYRRNLARKLLATGANPAVSLGGEMGGGAGFWFLAKYSRKNNEVTLSEAAGDRAEQIFLHETVHAATLLALDKGGLQAQQMIRLYESAKKQGLAEGQYGMKNVGEFVAEAFTNPEFQKILKSMKAPEGNLWKRFVALVRRILGLSDGSQDMLTAALEVGAKVMRENMPLRAARSVRAEDGPAFAGRMNAMPDNQAPGPQGDAQSGASTGNAVAKQGSGATALDAARKAVAQVHRLAQVHGTIYVRWANSATHDLTPGARSRDHQTGEIHSGLSSVAIDASMSPGRVAKAIMEYGFSRIAEPDSKPRVYLANRVGEDTDGYDLIHPTKLLWQPTEGVLRTLDLARDLFAAEEILEDANDRLTRITDKFAKELTERTRDDAFQKVSQLTALILNDQSAPDTDGADDAFFGIADASPNNAREAVKPVVQLLNDTFKVNGRLSWWHKTVGTPFNLAQRVPEFKRVFDAVQNFINDVSFYGAEAAAKAPKIIPKLETWKDLGKSPISAEDNKAIAAPIFEGTLVWMRDESGRPVKVEDMRQAAAQLTTEQKAQRLLRNGKIRESVLKMWKGLPADQFDMAVNSKYDKEMLNAGVVWTDAELRNQFKLTDEQIGLYREFREATDKSLVDLALSDIIQYAGKDIDPIKDVIMGRSLAEGSEMVRDYLMDMAEANPERRNDLLDTANGVIDKANRVQQLIDRGYAPLQRFGRYTVYAKDENGEQLFFGMYENRWDAARATRQMRQQFPDATIETGMMSEEAYKLFQGISPETLEIFGTMLGMDSQADGATNEAFQQYLKLAKSNRSAMKRLIERKGIAGYSEDASRVLASFLYSNARQTASNLHVGEIMNGVNDIPKDMGDAKDMAMKLARYTMDPQEEAQALRGLLFAQYLGGSIASAMINALQPAQVTFPYLSQFVGVKKSATIMAQAVKDALKRSTGDARLDAALKKAEDDGIVSPQEIFQLMAQAQGKATLKAGDGTKAGDAMAAASNTLSRLSLGWGKVFSIPEQFNRRSTFIAAYRTAMEKGDRNPAAFAEQAVKETQFVYNKGNRPQWARGSIGALAFTFKTYSISYVELMQRMAKSGPEGRRAAMLMVGVLFLMAGAGGLPGVEDAEDVIDGIAQRVFGLNFQTRQKRQEWLADLFGEGGARFIENGLSGLPWSPTDVSGRLGLGNLIPGTGIFIKKQDYTRDVSEIAGPAADMTKRFLQGAGLLLQGEVLKAGEIVSPVAIRNMIQGGRMAATDQYTDARGRKVIDTTMGEAALKTIGFQPANVARVQDATRTVQQMVALNKIRESEIADKWAKAIVAKDQDGIMDAQQEMRDWNQANPDSPIRIDLRQIRKRVQALREDKTTRIERTAPKEIRQEVRRELEGRA